jgi:CheY-like chemotaxis protein/Tfp pilus assembly protein PilF
MESKSPQQMTILIVEDQQDMLQSIKTMLEMIHYGRNVHGVSNGKEAWKFLSKGDEPVDFIIAEYEMPDMNGMELLTHLRQNKKFRDIPFLMITAEADRSLVAEAAEHDVDGYLTKPFVTAALEQKINEVNKKIQHPDAMTLHLRKARDLEDEGDVSGALQEVGRAIAANPGSSRPLRELGRLHAQGGDIPKAIDCFQKAVQVNCLDVSSYHYLGQLYLRKGKIDEATNCLAKAIDISPRHSERALKLAYLLLRKGRLSEAEKVFILIMKNNPDNIDLHEEIAEAALENNFQDMAIKCFRLVVKKYPARLDIHKKLGLLYYGKGQNKNAALHMKRAAKKYGDDLDFLLALIKSFLAMDRVVDADKWAKKAKELYPDNREVKKLLLQCL